jgi:hypothetical protein
MEGMSGFGGMCRLAALGVALLFAVCPAEAVQPASPLRIESDFPSGNADVLAIDDHERTIRVQPTIHPDRGWACWWYFKVSGIRPGETLTLDVGKGTWATPTRAAYSYDNKTWHQTFPGRRAKDRIIYRQSFDSKTVWFAWGPPFTGEDAARLVESLATQQERAESFVLCRTREGRDVPALHWAPPDSGDDTYGVWIQARQHAWESGSSWVCRGFAEWFFSDDPRAVDLRSKTDVTIVPVMDIDNVARGAGGKSQRPHDHNRDWSDTPHWPEVAAAIERISRLDRAGRFDVFIDLHNPSARDLSPFFYVPPRQLLRDLARRNLDRFHAAAVAEITGPMPVSRKKRESGPGYDTLWRSISKNWVAENTASHVVAATLETSWNTAESTSDNYRQVGRQLGLAVERYLRSSPRLP